VEQFSNGITVISVYLHEATQLFQSGNFAPIESTIHQVMKEASLLYCIPRNKFKLHFAQGKLSLQETVYAHCCWVFTSHFLSKAAAFDSI